MNKTFSYDRFDVHACDCDSCFSPVRVTGEFDGKWIKAEDAINRDAVLTAQIRTLELQLKETKAAALSGMDAAKRTSTIQLDLAQKARAESSPDALASERAANAVLTEENEALRAKLSTPSFTAGYSQSLNAMVGLEGAQRDVAADIFMNGDGHVTVFYGEKRIYHSMAAFAHAHPRNT